MRIRLQLLLPLLIAILMGAGFLLAAATVADGVRAALTTVPGLTRERAVEAAVRSVTLAGVLVTLVAILAGLLLSRMIVGPLTELRRTLTRELAGGAGETEPATPVAEIRDVARGIHIAAGELRDRHVRALREQSELSALVESVSEGIIQVDGEGRIERSNRAARSMLGISDDLYGRPVAALFRSGAMRELVERGAAGDVVDPAEVVLDERRILVTVSPQEEGGVVATFVDLTDLRRLEEVRRDFVANASHELKTPLTSIRGYSETLLHGDLPASEQRQFLETIARNADRLQRIVDDLLDLSRLETGRWEPILEPVHVLRIAGDSWEPFAERAAGRDVRFTVEAGEDDLVLGDRRALDQVFTNLFDNALRYTAAGGRIHVRARDGGPTPEGRTIATEVADSGAGIPRDALPRIFERFYRVDPARSRAEGGTGLGLSIVKHMIESMGGAIRAESTLGKGTAVVFQLPAADRGTVRKPDAGP